MEKLSKAVPASQIHPRTKQEIAETELLAGTQYKILTRYRDPVGTLWLRIDVDGYWYDILPGDARA